MSSKNRPSDLTWRDDPAVWLAVALVVIAVIVILLLWLVVSPPHVSY